MSLTHRNARPKPDPSTRPEALPIVARWAIVLSGGVIVLAGLDAASMVFAPLALAVVFGLMFAPLARRIEEFRVPPAISALILTLAMTGLLTAFILAFAWPLSVWFERLPEIWAKIQAEILSWQGTFPDAATLRSQFGNDPAASGMSVTVDGGKAVESAFLLAPAMVSQIIVFLAGLYFFIATRDSLRNGLIGLCSTPTQCRRVDRVIARVEIAVSHYMLAITAINLAMGVCVGAVMWMIGAPTPWLWGILACIMNFVPYVGTGIMVVLLLGVGMTNFEGWQIFLPALGHSAVNLAENQFVTPQVLGRTMTLNPFAVFFAILFWLWLWGPIGGLVAVPLLLVAAAVVESGRPRPAVRASTLRNRA
jgi:predicted PurR-regulated permease PerM